MRLLSPFSISGFAVLWSGLSLSIIGDQLFAVVFTWIAVRVFGGNAGYLSALQAAILLGATVFVGRWTDPHEQRHCMIVADISRAAVLIFVVSMWSINGDVQAWLLILALIGLGVGEAMFRPALQSVVPRIVKDAKLLPAANGLLDATGRAARLIGPAMIGPLALFLPVRHFLTVDALSFLLSAFAILSLGHLRAPGREAIDRESVVASVARGFQATRHHPVLNYTLGTYGLLNAAWNTVYYLALPMLIMKQDIRGPGNSGLGALGLVIAVYGGSNLISTLIFGNRDLSIRPQRQIFGGSLVIGSGLLMLVPIGLLPHEWLLPGYLFVAAVTAVGGPMKDIPFAVLRQTRLAPRDIPAAMRAYLIVHSAGMLIGWLLMPTAIALVGPIGVIILCGTATVGVGMVGLALYAEWTEPGPRTV
jgi:MFS transporter, DHA3 family, macrolide efflux protein